MPRAKLGNPNGHSAQSGLRHREGDADHEPATRRVGGADGRAVGVGDLADDGQAEPGALASAPVGTAEEAVEELPELVLGRARAVVAVLAGYATERMSLGTLLVWAVVGYGLWTLTEYWLHRIVFHFEPEDGLGAKLHWLIHGVHHEHPNDPNRLVMPPTASIPLAAIFVVLYRVLFGAPAWLAVSAGFLLGYVVYDTMHWYLHHRIPRSRVGRRLRELHLRHHFQDDTRGFGISAPYWDRVFRTAPVSRREAERRSEG